MVPSGLYGANKQVTIKAYTPRLIQSSVLYYGDTSPSHDLQNHTTIFCLSLTFNTVYVNSRYHADFYILHIWMADTSSLINLQLLISSQLHHISSGHLLSYGEKQTLYKHVQISHFSKVWYRLSEHTVVSHVKITPHGETSHNSFGAVLFFWIKVTEVTHP